jgi:hypothetical protein
MFCLFLHDLSLIGGSNPKEVLPAGNNMELGTWPAKKIRGRGNYIDGGEQKRLRKRSGGI